MTKDRVSTGSGEAAPGSGLPGDRRAWYLLLNRYHWFVLMVAALGWLFDTMDQQLFALARTPAMKSLLVSPTDDNVKFAATVCTSVFMVGWAVGGLVFGVLGDRVGRAKVMLWTILIYSVCTGLSSFSVGLWDFAVYRFLTGLGVGGEFAVGVALVAEVMPERARPYALGLLQASSTVGNSLAGLAAIFLGIMELKGGFEGMAIGGFAITRWRVMFMIGALPAFLAILIRSRLKEPEAWLAARQARMANPDSAGAREIGSYRALFSSPRWRHNALVGLALGCSGIIGLWGIGFFTYDLLAPVFSARFRAQGYSVAEVAGWTAVWVGITSLLQNFGGFFGMYWFGYVSGWLGRRLTFAICFLASMFSTAFVFAQLDRFEEVFWMIPIMGFCQFSLFGGYAIYFPELFPTHLRSTGTSFCYNVGRVIAAAGPLALGMLTKYVYTAENGYAEGFRWAAVTMCAAFLIGLAALPFAPETRGKPLPE